MLKFWVYSGLAVVVLGLGAWRLVVTDHTLMLLCLVYAVVLYWWFVKDEFNG